MKVILKEDVKALGKKGDVVEVSDGYARNFILKTGKGVEANGKNLNDLKLKKANDDKVAQEHYEAAVELGKKIEAGKIQVSIKTGEGGKTGTCGKSRTEKSAGTGRKTVAEIGFGTVKTGAAGICRKTGCSSFRAEAGSVGRYE